MLLDISEDGYTILKVYPISKSPITFNGTIDAPQTFEMTTCGITLINGILRGSDPAIRVYGSY